MLVSLNPTNRTPIINRRAKQVPSILTLPRNTFPAVENAIRIMRPIFMYKVQLLVLHKNQETLEKEKGLKYIQ